MQTGLTPTSYANFLAFQFALAVEAFMAAMNSILPSVTQKHKPDSCHRATAIIRHREASNTARSQEGLLLHVKSLSLQQSARRRVCLTAGKSSKVQACRLRALACMGKA